MYLEERKNIQCYNMFTQISSENLKKKEAVKYVTVLFKIKQTTFCLCIGK